MVIDLGSSSDIPSESPSVLYGPNVFPYAEVSGFTSRKEPPAAYIAMELARNVVDDTGVLYFHAGDGVVTGGGTYSNDPLKATNSYTVVVRGVVSSSRRRRRTTQVCVHKY